MGNKIFNFLAAVLLQPRIYGMMRLISFDPSLGFWLENWKHRNQRLVPVFWMLFWEQEKRKQSRKFCLKVDFLCQFTWKCLEQQMKNCVPSWNKSKHSCFIRNGNPELDSVSSYCNESPEEINETYYKFNEVNETIPLPWFNDFHTKPSKGWYILPTGFTALGQVLEIITTGWKAVSLMSLMSLMLMHWTETVAK